MSNKHLNTKNQSQAPVFKWGVATHVGNVRTSNQDKYGIASNLLAVADGMGGHNGGEELAVAFQNTYDMPIYITHTMNVFGERQHPEKFIPMTIKNVREGNMVTIHSDRDKKVPGSRHYIHAKDVADGCLFLIQNQNKIDQLEKDYGGAKCPKFNLVGPVEWDNLELAQKIARAQNKELKYKMVDFHTSRPGHDLRYALDGGLMKELGWEPKISIDERINQVVRWTLENERWLKL